MLILGLACVAVFGIEGDVAACVDHEGDVAVIAGAEQPSACVGGGIPSEPRRVVTGDRAAARPAVGRVGGRGSEGIRRADRADERI